MKELLEAGVHFGHQTRRWNPKMKPYIYGERNGIYIIDLHKTRRLLEDAHNFVRDVAYRGGKVLFVGTKKQAQESIEQAAKDCGQFYVNQRWLGGMLTNYKTISERIERLRQLERMRDDGTFEVLPKKEAALLTEELTKLERVLGGIKDMNGLPHVVFVVDLKKEHIAVKEARKLEIPIVGVCDTNCDPDEVNLPIPGNDDAIRALKLMASKLAEAAKEGYAQRESEHAAEAAERAEEAAAAAAAAAQAAAQAAAERAAAAPAAEETEAPAPEEAQAPPEVQAPDPAPEPTGPREIAAASHALGAPAAAQPAAPAAQPAAFAPITIEEQRTVLDQRQAEVADASAAQQ